MRLAAGRLRPHVLGDEVVEHLRDAILRGMLRNGERIVEDDVAEMLGVSRGPVRDALRQLELEGLVLRVPRRGAYVASLTASDADEILAIRAALEPVAVRYVIERADPDAYELLDDCLKRLQASATAGDWPAVILLDMEFHERIYQAAARRRLQRIWEMMRDPLLQTFQLHSQFFQSIEEVPCHHRALLDIIKSGDTDAAERAAREHVLEFRDLLLDSMRR